MSFTIVRAAASDWTAYAQIRLRSLREEPDAYGSDHAREASLSPETWQQRIAAAETLLAYADGSADPVGTATGLPQPEGDTLVVAMYVDPVARRTGCAHAMLDRLADLGRTAGQRRLLIHVTDTNAAADRCYTAYGFVPTGRRFPLPRDPSRTEIELDFPLGSARSVNPADS